MILLLTGLCSVVVQAGERGIDIEAKPEAEAQGLELGSYRALLIGNDHYRDQEGRWKSLQTAVAGARAMKELLESRYGFDEVILIEDGDRSETLRALSELARRVRNNDSVLVYYAGHGYLDEETGQGFWVPVDARGDDASTFIRNSTIRDELGLIAARADHTLLVADSCFSGSLLRSGVRGIPPDTNVERYYQKVASKKSVQIISAGGVEFVDDDYRDSGHSPFTYFLLNELTHNDQPLMTVSELSNSVEKAVANNVKQVPESGVLYGAGDELGEFIFLNLNVYVQGVDKSKVKVKVNVIDAEESAPATRPADRPGVSRILLPPPVL